MRFARFLSPAVLTLLAGTALCAAAQPASTLDMVKADGSITVA
jgi:hypothetical protein